jgi:hypothetical protein
LGLCSSGPGIGTIQFGTGQKSMHTSHPVHPSSTITAMSLGRFFSLAFAGAAVSVIVRLIDSRSQVQS